ncbi:MAG: succinate dehydrogenase cytochrome b subunit [Lentisphaeraceae bacterium]|nr:succinate dehydrogenase cytochrome b subunit [Lentisphaeraceae bacterium]
MLILGQSKKMSQNNDFLKTTLGKKVLMAVTGLLLVGFLTSHLAGNFLLLPSIGGKEQFNEYSHWLITHPLIIPMELGLLALFFLHIFTAVKVSLLSKAARPERYAVRNNLGESTFASRTMLHTGGIILVFLVIHLVTFKFGKSYEVLAVDESVKIEAKATSVDKALPPVVSYKPKRDLYRTVVEMFQKKWYSILYIVCMIIMGIHLCHGIRSAFQTLGLNHPRYNCCIKKISCVLAIVFAVGYSIFPIYFGFIHNAGGQ